jgi:hypothetical protein
VASARHKMFVDALLISSKAASAAEDEIENIEL